MDIKLKINEKPIELDEFLDEEEMDLSPFGFCLVELSQYINGSIYIFVDEELNVELDLFSDFMVCFEEILDSITSAKLSIYKKWDMWFCEQGSDFHIYYEVSRNAITLSYVKGREIGIINRSIPDFSIQIDSLEYVRVWENIFKSLIFIFEKKLNKKINLPF
ncbi:hypothetical protein [Pectobacterium polonicum]|uniref:hypothetical protein n=1 Tax=Pectobacterium polonicum TaxID=2485124 RepID=UPI002B245FEA|nr:hypothetical protein [Pectobacterium polonicum]